MAGERTAWPPDGGGLLPGRIGAPADRPGRGGLLGFVDYGHPVFEVFGAPRSGDVTTARFFRFRPVEPAPGATVAARFDDGNPALAGQVLNLAEQDAAPGAGGADAEYVVMSPAGARLPIAAGARAGFLDLAEQGGYEVRDAGAAEEPPPLSQPDGGSGTVM